MVRRPPLRRPGHRPDQAGPARRLPVLARPGGLPGRRRRSRCATTTGCSRPTATSWPLVARGIDPVEVLTLLRGDWHCGYDPPSTAHRAAVHPAGHPVRARRRAGARRGVPGATTRSRWRFVGDGAHQRGRLPRGAELRRRLQGPGRLLRAEQRLRDQRPAVPADRRAVAGLQGRRLRRARRAGRRQRPGRRARRARPARSRTPAPARARSWSRRTPTGWRRTPTPTTPPATATTPRSRPGADRDPIARLEAVPARRAALLDDAASRQIAERGRGVRRRPAHPDERRTRRSTRWSLFDHVYAEPTPQLREQREQLRAELAAERTATSGDDLMATRHHGAGAQRRAARRDGRRRPGASSSARTSARSAASSGSPTACQAEFGEDRCFDTPLAEAGIVGFAVGMAMYGLRPVVEMQFDAFAYPAFEQIVSHVAKMRNRTRGRDARCRSSSGCRTRGGIGGVEHHCDSSEAYYAHTPGPARSSPRRPSTTPTGCCARRSPSDDPVVFLEPKKLYWSPAPRPDAAGAAPSRSAGPSCGGPARDATLIAYGPSVPVALEAAEAAAGGGLGPGGRRPALAGAVRRRDRHAPRSGAPAGASSSTRRPASPASARRSPPGSRSAASTTWHAPVLRVAGFDIPYPPPMLEHTHLPGVDRILDAVARLQWDDQPDALMGGGVTAVGRAGLPAARPRRGAHRGGDRRAGWSPSATSSPSTRRSSRSRRPRRWSTCPARTAGVVVDPARRGGRRTARSAQPLITVAPLRRRPSAAGRPSPDERPATARRSGPAPATCWSGTAPGHAPAGAGGAGVRCAAAGRPAVPRHRSGRDPRRRTPGGCTASSAAPAPPGRRRPR